MNTKPQREILTVTGTCNGLPVVAVSHLALRAGRENVQLGDG